MEPEEFSESEAGLDELRELEPHGIDLIVEVAPAANAGLDAALLAKNGTVAAYATDGGNELELSVRELMYRNARYQLMLVYTVPAAAKDQAVADVTTAAADGALPVGTNAGLPLHRWPPGRTSSSSGRGRPRPAQSGIVILDEPH